MMTDDGTRHGDNGTVKWGHACFPFFTAAATSLYVISRKVIARFCWFVSVTCDVNRR